MTGPILVINPNASIAVTQAIDQALDPLRAGTATAIEVVGTPDGPAGIETQGHIEQVVPLVLRTLRDRTDASAYVIACFSDPGLHAAREATSRPVLGIGECAVLTALTLGPRFGLISILPGVISRHIRFVRSLGIGACLAGDRAIGRSVTDLSGNEETFTRLCDVGMRLRDEDGADVLVLACAGMAQHRSRLAAALKMPVVEPTQAAVTMAVGQVSFGW